MKTIDLIVATLLVCSTAFAASPSSINNDDSCDIKVGPAATLLLPYFEVDVSGNSGRTTLFTLTNVTRYPQVAHVTLWSDWAYPVMTFNIFLTGYDVQAINLGDVLLRGVIAPPNGTSQATTPGTLSVSTNPNLRSPLDCGSAPGSVPGSIMAEVRRGLTLGFFHPLDGADCNTMGGTHANAAGYATIDVVARCTNRMPSDPDYYTTDLLFDNVLIGDYQQIGPHPAGLPPSTFDAGGNPMVHLRAVPEGGGAGSNVGTDLPYTFYDRYTPAATRTIDRRQPLPSTFAARFIQGGPGSFATNFTIWREGVTGSAASCASYPQNAQLAIAEVIRFDEHENASLYGCVVPEECRYPALPATSSFATNNPGIYPALNGPDVAGWIYLNLTDGGAKAYSLTGYPKGATTTGLTPTPWGTPRASQNWVTMTMFGDAGSSHLTAELDAASLGNGCSPATYPAPGFLQIAPAGRVFVCPPGTTLTNGTTALCTGTNANPNP